MATLVVKADPSNDWNGSEFDLAGDVFDDNVSYIRAMYNAPNQFSFTLNNPGSRYTEEGGTYEIYRGTSIYMSYGDFTFFGYIDRISPSGSDSYKLSVSCLSYSGFFADYIVQMRLFAAQNNDINYEDVIKVALKSSGLNKYMRIVDNDGDEYYHDSYDSSHSFNFSYDTIWNKKFFSQFIDDITTYGGLVWFETPIAAYTTVSRHGDLWVQGIKDIGATATYDIKFDECISYSLKVDTNSSIVNTILIKGADTIIDDYVSVQKYGRCTEEISPSKDADLTAVVSYANARLREMATPKVTGTISVDGLYDISANSTISIDDSFGHFAGNYRPSSVSYSFGNNTTNITLSNKLKDSYMRRMRMLLDDNSSVDLDMTVVIHDNPVLLASIDDGITETAGSDLCYIGASRTSDPNTVSTYKTYTEDDLQ